MTSLAELFPKCRKLAYDARQQLAQIQANQSAPNDLFIVLEELNRQLDTMEQLLIKETSSQRQVWKHKIAEIRQECASLQAQGSDWQRTHQNMYQRDRHELLRRRNVPTHENQSDLQHLAAESQSLEQSTNMVFGIIAQGEASLNGLVDQRNRLRGVRGILSEIGNRLGLSQATMRIIERRDITDAYLVGAGMVVTCLVIYFVWF
jgi:Golgi SNAP receptor complex protein 2